LKGLCEVLRKPLATVSMLEAVALMYGRPDETATCLLDAGRGEIYVGEYQLSAGGISSLVEEYIAKLDALVGEAACKSGHPLTPDAKIAEVLQAANIDIRLVPAIHADGVGRIGIRKLIAGENSDPATIDVNYIRRSDAEIFAAPKH